MKTAKHVKIRLLSVILILLTACSSTEEVPNAPSTQESEMISPRSRSTMSNLTTDEALESFAIILSKAVYNHKGVRELLKSEVSKYFDKNSDVLYAIVKRMPVGQKSFREILLDYTSEQHLSEIENAVPMLNILVPKNEMFNLSAENLDSNDREIPIALSKESGMVLYLNGNKEMTVEVGYLPDFHTFVVNENTRVEEVGDPSRGDRDWIKFKSPNYDGRNMGQMKINYRANYYDPYTAGIRAVEAYQYFKGFDNDEHSIALQRDYIYYGMTPTSEKGTFNNGITEYLLSMEVDPHAYFKISDQTSGGVYIDPHLIKNSVTRKDKKYSEEELVKKMWAQGSYDFRIEIIYSNSSMPTIVHVPLYPEELWNFNIESSCRKGNMFRARKYTYKIDPKKFTSRRVDLTKYSISLGKWDLSKEGTERYIRIFEEDKSQTIKETIRYTVTKMNSSKINGSIKIGLGTDFVSGNVSTDISGSTTTQEEKNYELTRNEEDDALGTIKVYFYDPIIEAPLGPHYFILHEYNTGVVSFTITADYV